MNTLRSWVEENTKGMKIGKIGPGYPSLNTWRAGALQSPKNDPERCWGQPRRNQPKPRKARGAGAAPFWPGGTTTAPETPTRGSLSRLLPIALCSSVSKLSQSTGTVAADQESSLSGDPPNPTLRNAPHREASKWLRELQLSLLAERRPEARPPPLRLDKCATWGCRGLVSIRGAGYSPGDAEMLGCGGRGSAGAFSLRIGRDQTFTPA